MFQDFVTLDVITSNGFDSFHASVLLIDEGANFLNRIRPHDDFFNQPVVASSGGQSRTSEITKKSPVLSPWLDLRICRML